MLAHVCSFISAQGNFTSGTGKAENSQSLFHCTLFLLYVRIHDLMIVARSVILVFSEVVGV